MTNIGFQDTFVQILWIWGKCVENFSSS